MAQNRRIGRRRKRRPTILEKMEARDRRLPRPFRPMPRYPERKASPFVWPDYRSNKPIWHLIDLETYVREGFSLNSLVYSAIMYKVRSLWQVPLRAYSGDPKHPEPLDAAHPLSQLVARPNPHQSFEELQGQNTVYLNVAGNCYLWFDREKPEDAEDEPERPEGLPYAIYSLRPDRVFVVPDKGDTGTGIKGFLYVPEGKSTFNRWSGTERRNAFEEGRVVPILPQDMMHVKLPNPGDPLEGLGYGLSPLQPAGQSVDVDNRVTTFLKTFFDHGTMPMGLLSFSVEMTPENVAEARERWNEVYGGAENWNEIAVLDQGGKYQRLTPTFNEMGFEDIDGRNESRILGPFGVPGILIGARQAMEHSTYSNFAEARRLCWEDTLVPESKYFEIEYRYFLSDMDTGIFVAYDYGGVPALQKDMSLLVEAWVKLVGHGVPKDDATEVVGLSIPPQLDGQVIYMPVNLMPVALTVGRAVRPDETEPGQGSEDDDGVATSAVDEERAWPGTPGLKKNRRTGA